MVSVSCKVPLEPFPRPLWPESRSPRMGSVDELFVALLRKYRHLIKY